MAKKFERILEKATDETLLDPNWDAILDCVDMIRSGEVAPKVAIPAIRKRLLMENPHCIHHALLLLDACVKNCGAKVIQEVATRECMEVIRDLAVSNNDVVKDKTLEILQCWSMAFVKQPQYKIIVDTHNLLKLTGVTFPPLKDAETMYIADVAPEWVDAPECFRCRASFGMITRKHHCRACGQIFCDKCSSNVLMLPHLGIEKPVRVCDSCYEKGGKPSGKNMDEKKTEEMKAAAAKKEKEMREKEEEDLQLALAISQSEAEAKEKERKMYSMYNGETGVTAKVDDASSITPSDIGYRGTAPSIADTELGITSDDPLAKYLNRDYWQKKTEQQSVAKVEQWETSTVVGAPPLSEPSPSPMGRKDSLSVGPIPPSAIVADDQACADSLQFCESIKEQVSMMDSRIRSNVARGRSIMNDSAIQALFDRLTNWHAEVLGRMTKLDEQRAHLEGLQDHLAHIGEARAAMDALREEHSRQMREAEEERRRQKQAAMQNKLEFMRAKKHEMLLNQRHMALARFQQNEMAHRMGGGPPPPVGAAPGGAPPPPHGYAPPQGGQYAGGVQPPPQAQQYPAATYAPHAYTQDPALYHQQQPQHISQQMMESGSEAMAMGQQGGGQQYPHNMHAQPQHGYGGVNGAYGGQPGVVAVQQSAQNAQNGYYAPTSAAPVLPHIQQHYQSSGAAYQQPHDASAVASQSFQQKNEDESNLLISFD